MKCILEENEVEVSGGGLNGTYSTIQFHFHWGDTQHHPGSEHMVNGHRYPMEVEYCLPFTIDNTPLLFINRVPYLTSNLFQMHIVSLKKGHTVPQAIEDSEGIAVLGFFINVRPTLQIIIPKKKCYNC